MVHDVILPKLGQTMEKGTIVEWLKEEGSWIERGEVLFTVESDKATLEVEATAAGFLRKILVPAGKSVPVLTPVGLMTRALDEDISQHVAREASASSGAERAESAASREQDTEAGDAKDTGRERVLTSPRARRRAREERVELRDLKGTGPHGRIVERDVEAYLELQPKASPVARRLADHEGVDLHAVRGTGPGGRVLKSDVEGAVATGREAVAGEPTEEVTEALEGAPIHGIRATIARRMHEAHQTTAPVTLTSEVNATAFVDLRERLKASLFDQLQFNVSYNDLLIKVVARALREFPYVNARLERGPSEELTGKVVRHEGGAHIGLAVDTERGLLVPVLRNADQKDLIEIARSVRKLIDRAQSGDATPDELTGGAFTITNLGPYDVDAFTPIINLPEVAILGVGRIRSAPAVVGEEITIQQKLWLSLTFDHRLVDGAPAARFLQYVKTLIEEPYLLLV